MKRRESILELRAFNIIEYGKFPYPVREFRFHPTRMWRFDFAWPDKKIAIEIEGGVFVKGRHSTGIGFTMDTEKYNQAVLLGWRVLRYTIKNLNNISEDLRILIGE